MKPITRRQFTMLAGATLVAPGVFAQGGESIPKLITRAIPASGEQIPAVGVGTAGVFNRDDEATRQTADAVIRAMISGGGRLIDTASTYRDAESVLGNVLLAGGLREKIFVATKLEQPDPSELQRSLARLKTPKIDLLQLHNVADSNQSLAQFKAWRDQGLCRYIGITSTSHSYFATVESVLSREKPDFVQIDYSLDDREAEKRILPLAAEVRAGVLTALPFGRGRLLRAVLARQIPDWASDFAADWPQFLLKYLLGDERITAVIPGTSNPVHMVQNLGAMRGRLPNPEERARMVAFIDSL